MSVAYHLSREGHRVQVLEKEPGPALHQSGRNSGVIHSGYNLKPGSDKARFCVEGSQQLREYCDARGVAVNECGILVVGREDQQPTLDELAWRAQHNGVEAHVVDGPDIPSIEPHARGDVALHAPTGASFDARGYVHALAGDAQANGATLSYDTTVHGIDEMDDGVVVRTSHGRLSARAVVNAAGLHADQLAARLAPDMRVIPFRGYYAELRPGRRRLVRGHIYSAPDLDFPFLGVHLSRRVDGRVIVGPGAMLAFGREAYRFRRVQPKDLAGTLAWPGFYRLLAKPAFRRLVGSEVKKSLRLGAIAKEAAALVPEIGRRDMVRSFAGNRAQMVDRNGNLVEDIVVRSTPRAVHVLNAVSPGLTCSLPFGQHVAKQAAALL